MKPGLRVPVLAVLTAVALGACGERPLDRAEWRAALAFAYAPASVLSEDHESTTTLVCFRDHQKNCLKAAEIRYPYDNRREFLARWSDPAEPEIRVWISIADGGQPWVEVGVVAPQVGNVPIGGVFELPKGFKIALDNEALVSANATIPLGSDIHRLRKSSAMKIDALIEMNVYNSGLDEVRLITVDGRAKDQLETDLRWAVQVYNQLHDALKPKTMTQW